MGRSGDSVESKYDGYPRTQKHRRAQRVIAMVTTIKLDNDVADFFHERSKSQSRSIDQVANDVLRREIDKQAVREKAEEHLRRHSFSSDYAPGVDRANFNRVYDQMEIDAYIEKHPSS